MTMINLATDKTVDQTIPSEKWEFDESVTDCFDQMLERSIPDYKTMRSLVHKLGSAFLSNRSTVIDLGASRGESVAAYVESEHRVKAVEISDPMVKVLRERFGKYPHTSVYQHDLRTQRDVFLEESDLILSILTLQFIPINYRQSILFDAYNSLKKGKALILVEKVMGNTAIIDDLLVKTYHGVKHDNGYSYNDIERKKLSLEGVLVPMTQEWNESMLRSAGFKHVECFFRNLNFSGTLCIK